MMLFFQVDYDIESQPVQTRLAFRIFSQIQFCILRNIILTKILLVTVKGKRHNYTNNFLKKGLKYCCFHRKNLWECTHREYSESKHLEARFKIVFIDGEKYQLRTGQSIVVVTQNQQWKIHFHRQQFRQKHLHTKLFRPKYQEMRMQDRSKIYI